MKKNIFLIALVLFTAVIFSAPSAKAENRDKDWSDKQNHTAIPTNDNGSNSPSNTHSNGPANNGYQPTGGGPSTQSTALPINNGVVFLFVAGMAVGIVTLKKVKIIKASYGG